MCFLGKMLLFNEIRLLFNSKVFFKESELFFLDSKVFCSWISHWVQVQQEI